MVITFKKAVIRGIASIAMAAFLVNEVSACIGEQQPSAIPLYNMTYQQLDVSGNSNPSQKDLIIGSILNLAIPKGAQLTITPLAKGSMEPVVLVDEATYAQIERHRFDEREGFSRGSAPSDQEVQHLVVNSYGKSRIDVQTSTGKYSLIVGALYEAPQPYGKPVPLALEGTRATPTFNESYRGVRLWFKVPGTVADGWQLQQSAQNNFKILRIEQLEVPYDDPPAVGIFVYGAGSIRPDDLALSSGGLFARKSYPFKVVLMHVAKC